MNSNIDPIFRKENMICEDCKQGTMKTIGIQIPSIKEPDEVTIFEMKCDKCGQENWYQCDGGKKG